MPSSSEPEIYREDCVRVSGIRRITVVDSIADVPQLLTG